jgi:hypothetical protein
LNSSGATIIHMPAPYGVVEEITGNISLTAGTSVDVHNDSSVKAEQTSAPARRHRWAAGSAGMVELFR